MVLPPHIRIEAHHLLVEVVSVLSGKPRDGSVAFRIGAMASGAGGNGFFRRAIDKELLSGGHHGRIALGRIGLRLLFRVKLRQRLDLFGRELTGQSPHHVTGRCILAAVIMKLLQLGFQIDGLLPGKIGVGGIDGGAVGIDAVAPVTGGADLLRLGVA